MEAKIARDIILAERILRSARSGLWEDQEKVWILRSSDAEQGALWFSILVRNATLSFSNDGKSIFADEDIIYKSIQIFLSKLYNLESKAADLRGD
ncbi:hypothetical protein [Laceyella sediminis]|uniref:hypothetical protein n=1 Tax=Laceyella sediminis TaxID=573074 RepID=UPI0011B2157B|nr:hypothetical protein [Laceyella sediminis]